MSNYRIKLVPRAEEDMEYHIKSGDKRRLKKIAKLLSELEMHPKTGTGQVELLKYEFSGKWSRRIDDVHRIVYSVYDDENSVVIYQMKNHYK